MKLERFCYSEMGTFGKLTYDGFMCYTIEQPWGDNKPFHSCIPEGIYTVRHTATPKHGNTLIVTNPAIGVYETDQGHGRYAILIHVANTMDDIEGCIGPGERLGALGGKWAVLDSRSAYNRLLATVVDMDEFTLTITHFKT